MSLNSASVVKRSSGLMSTPIEDDIVILNPLRDTYIGLDEIGRRIWDLLAEPTVVQRLCHQVAQEYQGDPLQIPADVIAFVDELHREGLLEVQE
jgi:hypothetical protein